MTNLDKFIVDLALILIASGIVSLLFRRIRLPMVLGYIVAGFLISPHFTLLPTVVELESINTWADIGVVFLMFALGLEFSFRKLSQVGSSAFVTALTVIGGMVAVGIFVGRFFGMGKMECIFLGCMISMSSTMIILKSLEEKKLQKQKFASLVLGTLVVEDVIGIFMMIILTTVSLSQNVSGLLLARELGIMLLLLTVWLSVGVYLIPSFLKHTRSWMNSEVLLIVSLGICFGMVVLFHVLGFSEALGAFLGGSILAGTVHGESIEKLVKPLKDLFGAIFFVSVGMMIDLRILWTHLTMILVLSFVVMFGQRVLVTLGILLSGQGLKTAIRGGCTMVQIGEFSFIIAGLGASLGAISDELLAIIVCVSVLTIFLTPLSMKHAERSCDFWDAHLPEQLRSFLRKYTSDWRDAQDRGSDWWTYLRRFTVRTVLITGFLSIIYYGGMKYLQPFMAGHIGGSSGNVLTFVILLLAMLPLMNVLLNTHSNSFVKLWLKSVTNRLPLMLLRTFRFLLCGVFIVMLLYRLFHLSGIISVPIALVTTALLVFSGFARSQALAIDSRFRTNFNEKFLAARKQESDGDWILDHIFVMSFSIKTQLENLVTDTIVMERYGDVEILRVVRGETVINMPKPDEPIYAGDFIVACGSRDSLEGYTYALERAEHIHEPEDSMVSLRSFLESEQASGSSVFTCCGVRVVPESPLKGKTLASAEFFLLYHGHIIGLERGSLLVADPPAATAIRARDLLWVIGTEEMQQSILPEKHIDLFPVEERVEGNGGAATAGKA